MRNRLFLENRFTGRERTIQKTTRRDICYCNIDYLIAILLIFDHGGSASQSREDNQSSSQSWSGDQSQSMHLGANADDHQNRL